MHARFEVRIGADAGMVNPYQSHLESPHFKKYAAATKEMIKSKKLIETMPVQLGSKMK